MRKRTKKASSARRWADHYTRQAKAERFPARSVYKLQEIQKKYRIIRKGDRILDLGCFPGSWLLYAAQQAGPSGRVFGVDIKKVEVELPGNVTALVADVLTESERIISESNPPFDLVISDMAPSTTGHRDVDAIRSVYLCEKALFFAEETLEKEGNFICKIFQGPDFDEFLRNVKKVFARVKVFRPKSTRTRSREVFIIGISRKNIVGG